MYGNNEGKTKTAVYLLRLIKGCVMHAPASLKGMDPGRMFPSRSQYFKEHRADDLNDTGNYVCLKALLVIACMSQVPMDDPTIFCDFAQLVKRDPFFGAKVLQRVAQFLFSAGTDSVSTGATNTNGPTNPQ